MRIPRSYVARYSQALNAISGRARVQLEAALMQVDYTMDAAAVREAVAAIMRLYCGASSKLAARLAKDFYDGLRAQFGVQDGYEAEMYDVYNPDATDGAVRAFMQAIVEGKAAEAVINLCIGRLGYEVNRSANVCVARNASADPRRPQWARIPMGAETCDFCLMLASRGFAYWSEDTASHTHGNCDCRVVPSWDRSPEAEGYDPRALYDEWQAWIDAKADERADRNGTTASEERQKIMRRYSEASKRAKARRKAGR